MMRGEQNQGFSQWVQEEGEIDFKREGNIKSINEVYVINQYG